MSSQIQENYLKCIYKLCEKYPAGASTNAIAEGLETKPATVTDMLKKLSTQLNSMLLLLNQNFI